MPKPGDSLRDRIAQVLQIKYQDVVLEKRLATTTADVFFIDDTNPVFPRAIAIEAKDWNTSLTSKDIADIYNLYQPSLANREIEFLWIIGRHVLGGSPRQSVNSLHNVRYSTFDEFRASLMNFNALLTNNRIIFDHHDAAVNFVHARVRSTDGLLIDHVRTWLKHDSSGLIVYGGYGLGKTTFSLYLASALSEEFLNGVFDRIPIRIALGGMYSKQDLPALICASLSGGDSGVSVKDFSYGLFLEMNRQGQYVLIFDGFDEMRHAMDIDDFVYTFEQMRPLFAGRAKIIILGRPDSFLSNQEEDQVLTAMFERISESASKLEKVEVAFFTKSEVSTYLDRFLGLRDTKLSEAQRHNYSLLMARLPDSEDNILSRPVQLKMFTRIIDECLSSDVILNRYELYKRFIYAFLSREAQKRARQPVEGRVGEIDLRDDRKLFMQAVAWWVLNSKKENRFLPDEIPIDIVPASLRAGRATATAVREAIVGSVIEPISEAGVLGSKARKYYFFPHKSYLEFLIANYFESGRFSIEVYRDFISNINHEILTFLEEGPQAGVDHLRQGVVHHIGATDPRIIEVCATDKRVESEVRSARKYNHQPSHIYTHYFFLKKSGADTAPYLIARLGDSTTVETLSSVLNGIADQLGGSGEHALGRALIVNCLTNISAHAIRNYAASSKPIEVYREEVETARMVLLSNVIKCSTSEFTIDLEGLRLVAQRSARGSIFVHIPWDQEKYKTQVRVGSDFVLKGLNGNLVSDLRAIMKSRNRMGPVLRVHVAGNAAERFV